MKISSVPSISIILPAAATYCHLIIIRLVKILEMKLTRRLNCNIATDRF